MDVGSHWPVVLSSTSSSGRHPIHASSGSVMRFPSASSYCLCSTRSASDPISAYAAISPWAPRITSASSYCFRSARTARSASTPLAAISPWASRITSASSYCLCSTRTASDPISAYAPYDRLPPGLSRIGPASTLIRLLSVRCGTLSGWQATTSHRLVSRLLGFGFLA